MVPEALMRIIPPERTHVGAHVKDATNIVGPCLMQPFGESTPHQCL